MPSTTTSVPQHLPHSADVLPFPRLSRPLKGPHVTELGQRGQFCGVLYVARQLRLEAVDMRTVVAHIRAHIANSGFPSPVTSRLRGGVPVTGAAAVSPKSEWLRAAVDAWVDARHFGTAGGENPAANPDRASRSEAVLAERFAGQGREQQA